MTKCNFQSIKDKANILSDEERDSIENNITLEEVKIAIKNLSRNKSPGPDGFTAEFFKFFINDFSTLIVRSANTGFGKGEFSISLRQGTIILIPKENKPKRFVKNLRPITLLSTVYKIISSCIANRLKEILPKIIGPNQHAFVQNRNISSCYRFIYDTLVYADQEQIPGMLLSVDFAKAFDSISWSFLYDALKFFNFGPNFVKWIQTFYNNLLSCVSVNGQYSDWFSIFRGVRQGDPSSPYLYLICAEVLSLMILNNNRIKGIKFYNSINILSQFADDTTLSLDGSEESLVAAIDTLTKFISTYLFCLINR